MADFDQRTPERTGIRMGLELAPPEMPGWPYTDFATGWYQIGYSAELAPGQVTAARWLNQDLVLFRTESGRLSLLNAYCPHMGAHLGHPGEFGGGVCGEVLQCPWHGWKWSAEGENVEIPYRPDQTVKAKVGKQEVREIDGMIFMWYDHAGGPPTWEWEGLPYVGDKSDYYPIDSTVDGPHLAKPQQIHENSADPHHFQYVHGSGGDAEFEDYIVEGHYCRNTMYLVFGEGRAKTWLTPDGPVPGRVDNFFWGSNLGIARFHIDEMVCIHLNTLTPVDDNNSIFFSTVTATRDPGATDEEPKGRGWRMMQEQHWQIRNDFHIWGNMLYRPKPIFTGPAEQSRYAFIRRHFDQFYPNSVYADRGANGAS